MKNERRFMRRSVKKDWLKKSSRSKADLFEVLVADHLARAFKIKKDFKKEINDLTGIVKKFENGQFRAGEEETRAEQTAIKLIRFLKEEGINDIKKVEWVERYHQTKGTLSDVDLILRNNETIGISLKSTRVGLGTQKNLGYRSLKKYLGLDIDKDLKEMWEKIRQDLRQRGGYLASISGDPKTAIKRKKRTHPVIEKIGKKYGYPTQVSSVKRSIKNFNNLGQKEKSNFVKLIFGLEENDKRLLNAVAQRDKISIYWNEVYNSIVSGKGLQARKLKNVSYGIYSSDKLILRLQASFTNGIGISAYCQRAFLA